MDNILKTLENHIDSVVKPEANKLYEFYVKGFKANDDYIEVKDKSSFLPVPFFGAIFPLTDFADAFVLPGAQHTVWVDAKRAGKNTKRFKDIMVHEYIHVLNQQVSSEYMTRNEEITSLDEGIAMFLPREGLGHITSYGMMDSLWLQKARVKNWFLHSSLSNILDKYLFDVREFNSYWQLVKERYEPYVTGYGFFKRISLDYGMEEVFKVVANPGLVGIDVLKNPKSYEPKVMEELIGKKNAA